MFKTLSNAWKLVDIRKKLLFTLLIIIAFRIGSVIPVPFLNMEALQDVMRTSASTSAEESNAWNDSLLDIFNSVKFNNTSNNNYSNYMCYYINK